MYQKIMDENTQESNAKIESDTASVKADAATSDAGDGAVKQNTDTESQSESQTTSTANSKVRELTNKAASIVKNVMKTVLSTRVAEQPPVSFKTPQIHFKGQRKEVEKLSEAKIDVPDGSCHLPSTSDFLAYEATGDYVDVKVITSKTNTYVWDKSAKYVTSPVIDFTLSGADGEDLAVQNTKSPFTINIDIDPTRLVNETYVHPKVPEHQNMYYHKVKVRSPESYIQVIIKPVEIKPTIDVFVKCDGLPTEENYDFNVTIPHDFIDTQNKTLSEDIIDELKHSVILPPEYLQRNGTGDTCNLGIRHTPNKTVLTSYHYLYYEDYFPEQVDQSTKKFHLTNFSIRIVTTGCRFWHEKKEKWLTDGCQVSRLSNTRYTACECNHLTSFGADFFVPPNTIDFAAVFTNLGARLKDNVAVLVMICTVFGLYLIVIFWARRKDKQDVAKWGVAPLADNIVSEKYCYQISVYTGMRKGAGTKSKIRFVLSGDNGDTGVRELRDENNKKTFHRGSINHFVCTVPECLGPLSFLRVWHDNSGKGKHASWYLDRIIAVDLQNNDTFFFICNRWMAVEEDDGMIDRTIPVAGKDDVTTFGNLFTNATRKRLTDSHLWISVVSRPNRSNFTRVQRVSCILSLLFTTMIANAMFFQTDQTVKNVHAITLGPFTFAAHQLWISFASSMVVLPINIAIDQLFRKSVPKKNKVDNDPRQRPEALSQVALNSWMSDKPMKISPRSASPDVELDEDCLGHSGRRAPVSSRPEANLSVVSLKSNPERSRSMLSLFSRKDEVVSISDNHGKKNKEKKRKNKNLPYWCAYIAWFLCFLSTVASAFFTFMYSMEWGSEKSLQWLSTMFLSIGESVIIIQPIKIIFIAIIISSVIKKPELEEETDDNDKETVRPKDDEELTVGPPRKSFRDNMDPVHQPDATALAAAREQRFKEMRMHRIIREVVAYCLFLCILLFLAHYNTDKRSFATKNTIMNTFWHKSPYFYKVKDPTTFWEYVSGTLIPGLYGEYMYNGQPLPPNEIRVSSDRVSFRVGPPRLRQLRVKPGLCKIHALFRESFKECNEGYGFIDEDKRDYRKNWKHPPANFTAKRSSSWRYRGVSELDNIPHAGLWTMYNGGGYVKDLIGPLGRAKLTVRSLRKTRWFDKYTRAVFVEFTVYNPNVNLFTAVAMLAEFPVSGNSIHSIKVNSFRLYNYLGGFAAFVLGAEIIYIICVVYFLGSFLKRLKRERGQFIKSFWNCIDALNNALSVTAIVMYISRSMYTAVAISEVTKLKAPFYSFQRIALWSELFGKIVAVVVFLSFLKVINLLRFNRRMSLLSSTLKQSAKDMSAFSVVFLIVTLSYAQFAYLLFGSTLKTYSSFITVMESLLSTLLGSFDYDELASAAPVMGPLFFFSFILLMVFALMNMFVSIINDTFTMVKADITKQSNEYEIVEFMWNRFQAWTGINFSSIFKDVQMKYLTDKDTDTWFNQLQAIDKRLDNMNDRVAQMYQDFCWDVFRDMDNINLKLVDAGSTYNPKLDLFSDLRDDLKMKTSKKGGLTQKQKALLDFVSNPKVRLSKAPRGTSC